MKSTYHIQITEEEQKNLEDVLQHLGVGTVSIVTTNLGASGKILDYLVPLSKYEILYIRLSVKTGKFIKVESQKQQEMESNNTNQYA